MGKKFTDQTAVRAYAAERFRAQLRQVRHVTADLDAASMTKPRPGGKWSIAALFDHMAVMNRLYLAKLEPLLTSAAPSPRKDWSPTLAGRLLLWGVNTQLKLPTAPVFVPPDPESDPKAVQRFIDGHEAMASMLERSAHVHWKSVRVSSPAADFVKLNLGDVFLALADHTDRHLRQIEATIRGRGG